MLNLDDTLKSLIVKDVPHDAVFADFSLKNAYDLLYIAQYASEGQVYAFAADEGVLEECSRVLEDNFQDNVALIGDSPLNAGDYINAPVDSAIYTIDGIEPDALGVLERIVKLLKPEGRLLLKCDALNADAAEVYFKSLGRSFDIYRINCINRTSLNTFFIVQKSFGTK